MRAQGRIVDLTQNEKQNGQLRWTQIGNCVVDGLKGGMGIAIRCWGELGERMEISEGHFWDYLETQIGEAQGNLWG